MPPNAADPGSANQGRLAQPGATIQLTASAVMSDGSARTVTTEAAWQSSNETVTTVSGGMVTAVALGWSEVSATYQGQRASVPVIVGNCAYSLKETGHEFTGEGGDHRVPVQTSAADCRWDATVPAGADWVSFPGGPRGSGTSDLAYRVTANPTRSARDASIRIADQNFAVHQAGGTCTYRLGATSANLGPAAAAGLTVSVTATPAECSWQATSNDPSWLTITAGGSGTGNGTVTYSVAANSGSTSRSGTLTIAGQAFAVTQNATVCSYTVTPATLTVGGGSGQGTLNVSANSASCAWNATSNVSWISITAGASGTGNGTVRYAYDANPGLASREGMLTVAGQSVRVTQQSLCAFEVKPAISGVTSSGGTGNISVNTSAGCTWTAASNVAWITVTPATATGGGSVSYTAAANTAATPRTGTLTIAGQSVTIQQDALTCDITAAADATLWLDAAGQDIIVRVTAPAACGWDASSGVPWITLTNPPSGHGTGSAVVTFRLAPAVGAERDGYIYVAGRPFWILQTGLGPTCSAGGGTTFFPTSITPPATGGPYSIQVSYPGRCYYVATSTDVGWITITGGATGAAPGPIQIQVAANTGPERTGHITSPSIYGSVTVTQAAGSDAVAVTFVGNRTPKPWFRVEPANLVVGPDPLPVRFDP